MELKFLTLAQIGIDITIIMVFILLIKRIKSLNKGSLLNNGMNMYESLLSDAKDISEQFNEQLKEKNHLVKKLNERLDEKIMSLNVLLSRADSLISNHMQLENVKSDPVSFNSQEEEIIKLASKGFDLDTIADRLSIPKGEVALVLDLRKKIAQLGRKEQNVLKNYVKKVYLD